MYEKRVYATNPAGPHIHPPEIRLKFARQLGAEYRQDQRAALAAGDVIGEMEARHRAERCETEAAEMEKLVSQPV